MTEKNKIEKLTPQQESKLIEYRDKWLKIGLSTDKCDKEKAELAVIDSYKSAGLNPPKIFIWLRSPLEGVLGSFFLTKLPNLFRTQVRTQVWDQVGDQVGDQVWAQVGEQVNKSGYGLHDANWLGFYEFFKNEVILNCTNRLEPLMRLAEHSGWWWPFENAVIFTEKPIKLFRNDRNQLHANGYKAIEYSDGFGIWALNGVRVPQYLAETSEGELDIEFFKKESNADIKAEFIRKYGIDRMQSLGNKICDAKGHSNEWFRASEYELIDMGKIFEVSYAPHLRMKNLTTGIWHFEAVSPECRTIEDALKFRANGRNIQLKGVK